MNAQARRRERLTAQTSASVPAAPVSSGLQIADLRVYPLLEPVSGRRYTVVRLETKSGITGYGECAGTNSNEVALARRATLRQPATAYEVVRRDLASSPGLMAAVNMALLDIVGKSVKAPIYQVLGGPTRNKARAMTALAGESDDQLKESLRRAREAGFRAFIAPLPAVRARNQGKRFVTDVVARLDALRSAAPDCDFVLDAAGALTPGDAASVTAAIQPLHPLWFDEPCPLLNLDAVRKISAENVTPLGFGRDIVAGSRFQDLLRDDAIDVLRPDIARNGISQIRRMAAMAEAYYVAVAPYHAGGPIATAAALHVAASLPNFYIQQIPLATAEQDRAMRAALGGHESEQVTDGFAMLPTGPGLGIHVEEGAFETYKETA
jgi:galactonate dehydratase